MDESYASAYVLLRELPDGRWCGVHRLMFHWTVHIDLGPTGYEDRYCFLEQRQAVLSMIEWDGEGDMPGDWHKHPLSGRRRDPATGETWHESER